jgi:predicted RNA binding protein YcfA (HicA-like mRNA interferase family)
MSDGRRERDLLVRELRKAGFLVERTGSGHWRVRRPDGGGMVIMAFSPRSAGMQKTLARLRDIGYNPKG